MKEKMQKNKKHKLGMNIGIGIVLFILAMIFVPPSDTNVDESNGNKISSTTNETVKVDSQEDNKDADTDVQNESKPKVESSEVKVHFIDVGQGDSVLIESDGHYMLIDAGENNKGTTVVNYLNNQGIEKLDYVIGTHPHSDHIGGLDTVIESFNIGKVIMPDAIHTTKTFEDVLDAIANNNLKITRAEVGNTYTLGSSSFTVISPNGSDYDDFNDYSVGIKLTNGVNSFLLAGDAEELSEREMLNNGFDLSADVLKLGHHGSSTSSYEGFLDKVDPIYAVISAGEDNQYGHPHVETLQHLEERNIKMFRTDKQSTIIFTSDGKNITVNKKAYDITNSDLSDTSQNVNAKED